MRFGSVCSGIEAASCAWEPLGWKAQFLSEIEPFPRAVLQHHYPHVPLHGDFTTIKQGQYAAIDLLVGGTPCQSFSVAGLRGGLDDDRGNLALEFLVLAKRLCPRWLVWENVPGVLSSNGGRDFGSILGGMVELGYGFAYRVLDAQHFGVPQRRRRVFVVGCFGDWRRAAAVLFERHSLQGNPPPSRQARQDVAGTITRGAFSGGAGGRPEGAAGNHFIAHTLRAQPQPQPQPQPHLVVGYQVCFNDANGSRPDRPNGGAYIFETDRAGALTRAESDLKILGPNMQVRRLTPRECERLQGFEDDYTLVPVRGKPAADGPRYKALGNSMAVPVMRWLGERITQVSALEAA